MDPDLMKYLGSGGITAALIALIFFVGKALIAEIRAMRDDIKAHTTADLAHHAEVKDVVVRLEGKIDGVLDERERTPIEGVPVRYSRPAKER